MAEVIHALGGDRPSRVESTAGGLWARLAADPSAYVDDDGYVFLAEHHDVAARTGGPFSAVATEPAPMTAASTELLEAFSPFGRNSRPGASRIIYLDFDGETVGGTAWNAGTADPKVVPPYDTDGSPSNWSMAERAAMAAMWQELAEDFSPFDVNVTTVRPASTDAFTRTSPSDTTFGSHVVVTGDRWVCDSCTSAAYLDSFGGSTTERTLAWVFPPAGSDLAGFGTVAAHAVGHQLSLLDDGTTAGVTAYGGQGTWGPIMGNASTRLVVQWSKGDYPFANNTEDDLAIIAGRLGLAGDVSSSPDDAIVFPLWDFVMTAEEAVGSATDVDVWKLDVTNGDLRVILRRPAKPNLVPRVVITGPAGVLANEVLNDTTTMRSVFCCAVANGRYTISVSTLPMGDFPAYGNVGTYALYVVRSMPPLPAPTGVVVVPSGDREVEVRWIPSANERASYTVRLVYEGSSDGMGMTVSNATATFENVDAPRRVKAVVTANTGLTASDPGESAFVDVLAVPTPPVLRRPTFDAAGRQLTVSWDGGVQVSPVLVTSSSLVVTNTATGEVVQTPVPWTSGSAAVTIPAAWLPGSVTARIVGSTGHPAPWTAPSSTAQWVMLGRAPSSTGAPGSTAPRGPVATTPPGTVSPRQPVPGA